MKTHSAPWSMLVLLALVQVVLPWCARRRESLPTTPVSGRRRSLNFVLRGAWLVVQDLWRSLRTVNGRSGGPSVRLSWLAHPKVVR